MLFFFFFFFEEMAASVLFLRLIQGVRRPFPMLQCRNSSGSIRCRFFPADTLFMLREVAEPSPLFFLFPFPNKIKREEILRHLPFLLGTRWIYKSVALSLSLLLSVYLLFRDLESTWGAIPPRRRSALEVLVLSPPFFL